MMATLGTARGTIRVEWSTGPDGLLLRAGADFMEACMADPVCHANMVEAMRKAHVEAVRTVMHKPHGSDVGNPHGCGEGCLDTDAHNSRIGIESAG